MKTEEVQTKIGGGRNTNLELMRIVAMIIIIAHHYVVNSGLIEMFDFSNITANMIFLQFAGFGDKMAINAFVLLSAYFMCTQKVTWRRVLKLVLEIYFYKILIYSLFLLFGIDQLNLKSLYKTIFAPFYGFERGFVGSFLAFYIMVPFLNIFVKAISQKTHKWLIASLLFLYTFISTFLLNTEAWSYLGWYITLYFIASYLRFYPANILESKKVALGGLATSVFLVFLSIILIDYIGPKIGFYDYYFFCADSQKFLALTTGLFLFLTFKNIKIRQSRFINSLAMTTFGVLLIHANSDAMRNFLWRDLFDNVGYYTSELLPVHFLISVIVVYVVCAVIDYCRIRFIEKPLFQKLDSIQFLRKECFM